MVKPEEERELLEELEEDRLDELEEELEEWVELLEELELEEEPPPPARASAWSAARENATRAARMRGMVLFNIGNALWSRGKSVVEDGGDATDRRRG